jgi:hypothetical protein
MYQLSILIIATIDGAQSATTSAYDIAQRMIENASGC